MVASMILMPFSLSVCYLHRVSGPFGVFSLGSKAEVSPLWNRCGPKWNDLPLTDYFGVSDCSVCTGFMQPSRSSFLIVIVLRMPEGRSLRRNPL